MGLAETGCSECYSISSRTAECHQIFPKRGGRSGADPLLTTSAAMQCNTIVAQYVAQITSPRVRVAAKSLRMSHPRPCNLHASACHMPRNDRDILVTGWPAGRSQGFMWPSPPNQFAPFSSVVWHTACTNLFCFHLVKPAFSWSRVNPMFKMLHIFAPALSSSIWAPNQISCHTWGAVNNWENIWGYLPHIYLCVNTFV